MDQDSIFCNACQLTVSLQEKNAHYGTEWHRYNVKRKCASLPPVPRALFESKVAAFQQTTAPVSTAETILKCKPCNKTFRSDAQYEQHVQSKKHKLAEAEYVEDVAPRKQPAATSQQQPKAGSAAQTEAVFGDAGMEEDGDAEDDQEDESAALPVTACLFCSHQSESLEQNVAHMTEVHSFFVPYVEYLQDLSGFIEYLGYKVGMGRVCIYCNGRGRARFPSVSALQQHMISKGHCKVRFEDEDEEEMHEFYDFTLDLSMEEASSSTALVTSAKPEIEDMNALGELMMNNGKVIGTRQMARYYKQRPRPEDTRDSVLINQMVQRYRLLALPGYGERDYLPTHEPRSRAALRWAERNDFHIKWQSNNQRHYRDSNPM